MTHNKINISILISLIFVGILLFILNLFIGSVSIPFSDLFNVFLGKELNPTVATIVLEYRFPQAATALFAGAALSAAAGESGGKSLRQYCLGSAVGKTGAVYRKTAAPDQQ